MRPLVYIVLLALTAILFKAFYWDSRNAKGMAETNASLEAIQPEQNKSVLPKKKSSQSHENMPLEQLGDTIGDKLKGKF